MLLQIMDFSDLELARQLQEQFDREAASSLASPVNSKDIPTSSKSPLSIIDEHWELTDPNPDIRALFLQYNERFFWGKLAGIEVKWSPRMTLCAGLCVYEGYGGLCSVRLSTPLLKLRPRKDLVETLLHEMIHAYLFVTQNNKDHDGHGPEFQKHMNRINKETGANISIYHNFHDEVNAYRQHWWRCDGPCQKRPPYFGFVKRSMNRAPAPRDPWWGEHQRSCGGTYTKVKEPEGYGQKGKKEKPGSEEKDNTVKSKGSGPDIRSFWNKDRTNSSKGTIGQKKPSSTITSGQTSSTSDVPQLPTLPESNSPLKHITHTHNQTDSSHKNTTVNESGFPTGISWKPAPRPEGRPTIKTIWDSTTDTNSATPHTTGSSQICDINSDAKDDRKFVGQGQTLGSCQGQGTSYLAQIRREMNREKLKTVLDKRGSSDDGNNHNRGGNSKTLTPSPSKAVRNQIDSSHKQKSKNIKNSPHKTPDSSPQKSIKEWFSSTNTQSSLYSGSSPLPGGGSPGTSDQSQCVTLSDDEDFTSPRKPLFKKVNPASNFTSPPFRRISLYNKDTPQKDLTSGSAAGTIQTSGSVAGTIQTSGSTNSQGVKRKHSGGKRCEAVDKEQGENRMKSWTRKPHYSTSDDSDIEEVRPPSKKLKHGSINKKTLTKSRDMSSNKTKNNSGKSAAPYDGKDKRNETSAVQNPGGERADNSASLAGDMLQSCPVCQVKVPSSQINSHLDQCLSFD